MSAFFPVTRAAIGSGQGKDERRQTGCLFFVQAESCGGTQITLSQKAAHSTTVGWPLQTNHKSNVRMIGMSL